MPSLDLNDAQAALLNEYLDRVLSDLSVEIAGTDRLEYREEIKAERRLLQEISGKLADLVESSEESAARG